jgi:AcrR family transcriptional regulator
MMAVTSPQAATGRTRFNRDDSVLAAAIEVISERGYAATTIQEVADRVGVLKGSLYHYFRSKEELLFRILEESYDQNDKIVQEIRALGLDAYAELMEYLRRISLWYLGNVGRANIFFTEGRQLTGDRLDHARKKGRAYELYIHRLVALAQQDGQIRAEIDDRLITRFLLGAVNNARIWPSRSGKQFTRDAIVEAFLELVRTAITDRDRAAS